MFMTPRYAGDMLALSMSPRVRARLGPRPWWQPVPQPACGDGCHEGRSPERARRRALELMACCTLGMDRIVHFSLRVTFPACGAAEPVHVGRV